MHCCQGRGLPVCSMLQFFAQMPFRQLSSNCQPWCFRIVFGVPRGHPTHGKRLLNCINLESGQFRGRSIWTMTALMIASTWDLDTFEDSCHLQYAKKQIASTWDLDTFEGYGGWVKDDFMFITWGPANFEDLCAALTIALGIVSTRNLVPRRGLDKTIVVAPKDCINLESVQLRRQISTEALRHRIYINLRFGQLRGLQGQDHVGVVDCINLGAAKTRTVEFIGRRAAALYQPEIWIPSRTFRPLSFQGHYFINLGSEFLRGSCGNTLSRLLYCINRGPDTFEDTSASE